MSEDGKRVHGVSGHGELWQSIAWSIRSAVQKLGMGDITLGLENSVRHDQITKQAQPSQRSEQSDDHTAGNDQVGEESTRYY